MKNILNFLTPGASLKKNSFRHSCGSFLISKNESRSKYLTGVLQLENYYPSNWNNKKYE